MLGMIEFVTYNSPPTYVTLLRDGEPVTVDGFGYEIMQTVHNRDYYYYSSNYINTLLIRNAVDLIGYHTYTFIVSNYAGITSKIVKTFFIGISDSEKIACVYDFFFLKFILRQAYIQRNH